MRFLGLLVSSVLHVFLVAGTGQARAKEEAAPSPEVPSRADSEAGKVRVYGAQGEGLTVDTGDAFSLNLKARMQLRAQWDLAAADAEGQRELSQMLTIATTRLWFSGHVGSRDVRYMLQLAVAGRDFREGATSPIYDAYLDWKVHRDLSVRVGQFFVPFDRLRTVREFALQMAERPLPVAELTLDRDMGVMLYSNQFLGDESPLAFRLGIFGGGGTNLSLGKRAGALVVGRLELRPLGPIDDDSEGDLTREARPRLALGAAAAHNFNTNRARSTTGARWDSAVVDYSHAALDLVFKWAGFALQAELLWRQASRDLLSSEGAGAQFSQSGRGWVVQSSYTWSPPFELVARLAQVSATETTDPLWQQRLAARGQEVGLGLNYYLNGHQWKVQADWIACMPAGFVWNEASHAAHLLLDVTL